MHQDRDGNIWFGTNGDGICRYDGTQFVYFTVADGLAGNAIRGILEDDDGVLWFATDGGLSRYDGASFSVMTEADGLSDGDLWSICEDTHGTLWIGTAAGVCRFNGKAISQFALPIVGTGYQNRIASICQDKAGNMWFATGGAGVFKYDGHRIVSYTTEDGLWSNNVSCVFQDSRGDLWFGTRDGEGGVVRYDGSSFIRFPAGVGAPVHAVWTVLEDASGDLWFGTIGGGAYRYDGATFRHYSQKDGLGNQHVQSILQDANGNLWFGTSGGAYCFDDDKFIKFTRDDWPAQRIADPMAPFARMVSGEWRVTFQSGTSMFDTWHWGPGKHSILRQTYGSDAAGNPWRALQVVYRHPRFNQVRMLRVSPFANGVGEGTVNFAGETVDAFFDLYQTGSRRPRKMATHRTFDGPDKYHETLLEDTGAGLTPLVAFDYIRSRTLTDPLIAMPDLTRDAARPAEHLKAFASLLGHTWQAGGAWVSGAAFRIQSTFEYVPYSDVIHACTTALPEGGEPRRLLDVYAYHHTGTHTLRCLVLSNTGGVYEGDITVLKDGEVTAGGGGDAAGTRGAVQIDLAGSQGDKLTWHSVRLDFRDDGTLRSRLWSINDEGDRTILLDVHHNRVAMTNRD